MKRKIVRGLVALALGYALLFTLRLGYGYLRHPTEPSQAGSPLAPSAFENPRNNYASSKIKRGKNDVSPRSIDQKYEKVAELAATTESFADDRQRVYDAIEQHAGLIQFQQSSGLDERRALHLAVGVDPERFDELVSELRQIGKLASIRIHKLDKTNDYQALQAKRISLEKARDSLIALKGQGGKIEELIRLEERILETEERIQNLGIQLGEFDEENEFCTVKLSLVEKTRVAAASIPFHHRAKVAFEWTTLRYLQLMGILACGTILVFVALLVLEKLRAMQRLVTKLSET